MVNIDLDAQLPRIGCPTLVIVGREDVATPPAMAQVIAQAIPGARLVELDAAAHLSNIEQAEAFIAALRAFLAQA
ncbi:MAG: alpha/beta hydrolase [Comamonadaceae bacterium]|nr:alpha/beta hydrolase [Comamonadaceae bacterium]